MRTAQGANDAIDAVIFDLDGTLADTLTDIAAAMDRVLRAAGLPTHDEETYRRFLGHGARALVEKAIGDEARQRLDEILAGFLEDYTNHLVVASRPYPGVEVLLAGLRRIPRPPALAVLSNKPHEATRRVVGELFEPGTFRAVYGHRPDWPKKPDPATALALAAELGAAPSRCLFVGDTAVDMETARRAGMTAIGCLWGFRDAEELREAGATTLVSRPDEIGHLVVGG